MGLGEVTDVLIGRERELVLFDRVLGAVLDGARRGLWLTGPPGIGKTALLKRLAARATEEGFLACYVRTPGAAGLAPGFPVGEVLEALQAAIVARRQRPPEPLTRVIDTLRGREPREPYPAEFPQIAHALNLSGACSPIAVLIDDEHAAPGEGIELLSAAIRAADTPVVMAMAARPRLEAPVERRKPESTADLWFETIRVEGLTGEAVALLAAALLGGGVLPSLSAALFERTFGNPLFVVETLRRWADDGVLVRLGSHWSLREELVGSPSSLRDMIADRLAALGGTAVGAARCLAVVGRDVSFEELKQICGADGPALIDALDALERQGLVTHEVGGGGRIRLTHPSYEQAALSTLTPTKRAALHSKVLSALRDTPSTSSAEIAHHAVGALESPEDLVEILETAARDAVAAYSHHDAARWFSELARVAPSDSQVRLRAIEGKARATIPFAPHEAIALLTDALRRDVVAPARLLPHRALAYRMVGAFDSALRDLEQALPLTAGLAALEIRHGIAIVHGTSGNLPLAKECLEALEADSAGTATHAKAIGHLGQVAFTEGALDQARRLWEAALSETQDEEYRHYLSANLAWLHVLIGHWETAAATLDRAIDDAVQRGDLWNAQALLCTGSRLAAWMGDIEIALERAHRSFELACRIGNPTCLVTALDAMALAHVENSRPSDAIALQPQIEDALSRSTEHRELTLTFATLAQAHLAAGDADSAESAICTAAQHRHAAGALAVMVDRLRAELLLAQGKPGEAARELRSFPGSDLPLESAGITLVMAQAELTLGDREAAERNARRAEEIYRSLGARLRAAKAEEIAVRCRPKQRGRPRATNVLGLTDREIEVVQLVAEGLTDREAAERLFLSVATVKKHLENAKRKVGVSRRAQLATEFMRQGLVRRP